MRLQKLLAARLIVGGLLFLNAVLHADAPSISNFILIDTLAYRYDKNLECEFAVAKSVDFTTLRVIRLEGRKGTYSVNYFAKSPAVFDKYGIKFDLNQEMQLHGAKIESVQSAFNLKNNHYDLILKVTTINSATQEEEPHEHLISLESQFFKDVPQKCLK